MKRAGGSLSAGQNWAGAILTVEQAINLAGHIAWPVVALIALVVLLPYISHVSRAAADLRSLLDRSGEMVDLAGRISALSETTSDLKAMQEVALAARPVCNRRLIEPMWISFGNRSRKSGRLRARVFVRWRWQPAYR